MSLYDTRTVGNVKVVMLKGQDGSNGKLAPIFTIDNTLVRISSSEMGATRVHVACSSETAITATSGNTNVATISSSSSTLGELDVDISSVAPGTCCIELSVNASGVYSAGKAYINVEVYAESGGGSSISKTRYTISSSSWSASANASGYYTYSVTLNPTLSTSFCPDVSCAGSTDSTVPTSAQKNQYNLIDYYDNTAANTLVLYAKTKPSSTFYIWVEGNNA